MKKGNRKIGIQLKMKKIEFNIRKIPEKSGRVIQPDIEELAFGHLFIHLLLVSFMSAITLLGTPAETYQYGTMYWMIGWSYFLVIPAAAYLYLPIFFKLEVTSAYEVSWSTCPVLE